MSPKLLSFQISEKSEIREGETSLEIVHRRTCNNWIYERCSQHESRLMSFQNCPWEMERADSRGDLPEVDSLPALSRCFVSPLKPSTYMIRKLLIESDQEDYERKVGDHWPPWPPLLLILCFSCPSKGSPAGIHTLHSSLYVCDTHRHWRSL